MCIPVGRGREARWQGPSVSQDQGMPDPRLGWDMDPSQERQEASRDEEPIREGPMAPTGALWATGNR